MKLPLLLALASLVACDAPATEGGPPRDDVQSAPDSSPGYDIIPTDTRRATPDEVAACQEISRRVCEVISCWGAWSLEAVGMDLNETNCVERLTTTSVFVPPEPPGPDEHPSTLAAYYDCSFAPRYDYQLCEGSIYTLEWSCPVAYECPWGPPECPERLSEFVWAKKSRLVIWDCALGQ